MIGRSFSKLILSYKAQVLRKPKIKDWPYNSFKALGEVLALFLPFFLLTKILFLKGQREFAMQDFYTQGDSYICVSKP